MTHAIYTAGLLGAKAELVTLTIEQLPGLPKVEVPSDKIPLLRELLTTARAALGELQPAAIKLTPAPCDPALGSSGMTLAVALAVAIGHGLMPASALADTIVWGELLLDGQIKPARGVVAVARAARDAGLKRIIVAPGAAARARLVFGIEVVSAEFLLGLIKTLDGGDGYGVSVVEDRATAVELELSSRMPLPDFIDVRGLGRGRKAMEIMIAGRHNTLLQGPQGSGKTMLARRVQSLLPRLEYDDAVDVTAIHDLARVGSGLIDAPPVRMPHHTVSPAGLLGSGSRPGEVTLAHNGVLFLDELPEFQRSAVAGLLESMRERRVSHHRLGRMAKFPADFVLLAASTLCPCGFLGHPERVCTDSHAAVERYQSRIDPLDDVFDLVCIVGEPEPMVRSESSESIRRRVISARARQATRYADKPWRFNSEIPLEAIEREIPASVGGPLRLRRVARTIADLDAARDPAAPITDADMQQALQYRGRGDR